MPRYSKPFRRERGWRNWQFCTLSSNTKKRFMGMKTRGNKPLRERGGFPFVSFKRILERRPLRLKSKLWKSASLIIRWIVYSEVRACGTLPALEHFSISLED